MRADRRRRDVRRLLRLQGRKDGVRRRGGKGLRWRRDLEALVAVGAIRLPARSFSRHLERLHAVGALEANQRTVNMVSGCEERIADSAGDRGERQLVSGQVDAAAATGTDDSRHGRVSLRPSRFRHGELKTFPLLYHARACLSTTSSPVSGSGALTGQGDGSIRPLSCVPGVWQLPAGQPLP
jgi:hypothetical protein